ncbi:MAG TPA: DUF2282 domain-containing protein [Gammaproteobacteria bacterium]|nr:DUF2282 domain-containing protein [Gammaproteobacteria bacterium]
MKNSKLLLKSALTGALAVGLAGAGSAALAAGMSGSHHAKHEGMQPCYGINAAYKNDCQSPGHSCAGQDAKARDPHAFVLVPDGLCSKIAGGSTKAAGGM